MAAQKGKDVLLKIGDGANPEIYTTVAGLRARTLSPNAKSVDATDSDRSGRRREPLARAGVNYAAVYCPGAFRGCSAEAPVRAAFFSACHPNFQLITPDFVT